MLLTDEQYVIKWLSQYGPLPRTQVVRLLRDKSPSTAERILKRLEQDHRIAPVGDGYYLGLDPYGTPDQRMILAVWVLLQFIDRVEPLAHYRGTLFFKITAAPFSSTRRATLEKFWFASVMDTMFFVLMVIQTTSQFYYTQF